MTINLDFDTIVVWILVGLVAGFLASRITLGHGLGLLADIVVGILGALLGGFLSGITGISIAVAGHPIISEILIAFVGAVILLALVRMFGGARGRRRILAR